MCSEQFYCSIHQASCECRCGDISRTSCHSRYSDILHCSPNVSGTNLLMFLFCFRRTNAGCADGSSERVDFYGVQVYAIRIAKYIVHLLEGINELIKFYTNFFLVKRC